MPRQYIVNSWVGAAEYPDGDQYSGEQIGNRNKPSIGAQVERSGDQWRSVGIDQHFTNTGAANINAYRDPEAKPKQPAKKKSAFEQICLADRNYSRLEQLSQKLDEELEQGMLSFEDWTYARKQMDRRLDRAWCRVANLRGWDVREKDEEIYSLCLEEMEEKHQQKRTQKPVDNQQEQGLSFSNELIDSLSDGNCFKLPLQKLLTAKEKMVKMLEILKS